MAFDNAGILDVVTKVYNQFGLANQAEEFLRLTGELFRYPGATFFFLDESGRELQVLARHPARKNDRFPKVVFAIDTPAIARLRESGKTLVHSDILAGRIISDCLPTGSDADILTKTGLIIPVISRNQLTGLIFIDRREAGDYTRDEITLVSEMVSRLAPAFEKEYIRESTINKQQELVVLCNCCTIIASNFDVQTVYSDFVAELSRVLDIDWSAITVKENRGSTLRAAWPVAVEKEYRTKSALQGGNIDMEIPASNMPFVSADISATASSVSGYQGIRSLLCVPLLTDKNELVGSLTVGSRNPGAYNSKQVDFLSLLAKSISLPLKNARLYADVFEKSRYDELTGLLNRRSMDEHIIDEINRSKRYGGEFSLILMDLDSMKAVNDTNGHPAGDRLLARVGKVINESIRSVDKSFRYGGDEFAILLPNTPIEAALNVSERIRKNLEKKLHFNDRVITASFGLSGWPENGPESRHLVAAADESLYKAKYLGGNRSCARDRGV